MKNILAVFCFFILSTLSFAAPTQQIIFFGDSLTDNGNLYNHTMKLIPKSPPYFNGRFSNGLVWSENLALNYSRRFQVYAVGGATAIFHRPTTKFVASTTLTLEIYKYILDTLYTDRSQNLFVIWVGDNDYMFYQDMDAESGTTSVVDGIVSGISTLVNYGARNFLILNLTDNSRTPYIQLNGDISTLHDLIVLHNRKLAVALAAFKQLKPEVKLASVDTYHFYNELLDNTEKYNQLYSTHITDTKNACWTGGYMIKNIQRANNEFASASLELNYTYLLGESLKDGNVPCLNPNEHLFWDDMHPTAIFHQLIARIAADVVDQENLLS